MFHFSFVVSIQTHRRPKRRPEQLVVRLHAVEDVASTGHTAQHHRQHDHLVRVTAGNPTPPTGM